MSNSNATVQGTLIAQQALTTLLAELPMLRQITTDFGVGTAQLNQVVNTHIVSAAAAIDYHTTNGYVPADQTQTNVQVTLNSHKHSTFAIKDNERSESLVNLVDRYAPVQAHALGLQLASDLFSVVTVANYANGTISAAGAFDRPKVIDIGAVLNTRKVMKGGRFLILAPGHYANLFKDTSIVSGDFSGGSDSRTGTITAPVHGFQTSEYSAIPGNGENLVGIAGIRESMALVMRLPAEPMEQSGGVMRTITEANTGLSVQMRQWYNWRLGQEEFTLTWMYGVAAANTGTLQRITSA